MKEIKVFEEAINQKAKLKELGINHTLLWAYRISKENGNKFIDFDDVILGCEVEEIAQNLRANGITEFTISSGFSGLIEVLAAFEKHGISIAGITTVNTYLTYDVIPAIKMKVN